MRVCVCSRIWDSFTGTALPPGFLETSARPKHIPENCVRKLKPAKNCWERDGVDSVLIGCVWVRDDCVLSQHPLSCFSSFIVTISVCKPQIKTQQPSKLLSIDLIDVSPPLLFDVFIAFYLLSVGKKQKWCTTATRWYEVVVCRVSRSYQVRH